MFQINQEDVLRLAQIVREETGNQVQEKNYSMLESRIRSHILKLGLDSMEHYWAHFKNEEKSERSALQSLMTTHYTFFFREFAHFELLEAWIEMQADRLKNRFQQTKAPMRVWSAACSRGQEVYSLAMFLDLHLLKKHGIPFEVVGTDIDAESVNFSRNGVYSIKEVNTIPQMYLSGNWKRGTGPIKEFAAVHPDLKLKTRFEVLNLLEVAKWKESQKFDIVFCRNVFIYFSEENVKSIALSLADRLRDQGLMISGMSEPLRFSGWNLSSFGPSCYQYFTPTNTHAEPVPSAAVAKTKATNVTTMPLASAKAATLSQEKPRVVVPISTDNHMSQNKYRVLCVDDSVTIQMLIKKIYSQDPLCERVDVAGNGKEARQQIDKNKYDVITLDIHMPEVSGIDFLEKFYNRKVDPPVIMVSSVNRTDVELATKALSLGAFDYVEKPAMNNLEKSSDEILMKTKMALRQKQMPSEKVADGFDASISQKIVIPDASQCVRVVLAGSTSRFALESVVRAQKNEYRSPALMVVWDSNNESKRIEGDVLQWTDRQVVELRDANAFLKPNHIYICSPEIISQVVSVHKFKSASLQVLDKKNVDLTGLKKASYIQVLIDESINDYGSAFERQSGFIISDVTPATSFASLSIEFFANLRKAAA